MFAQLMPRVGPYYDSARPYESFLPQALFGVVLLVPYDVILWCTDRSFTNDRRIHDTD